MSLGVSIARLLDTTFSKCKAKDKRARLEFVQQILDSDTVKDYLVQYLFEISCNCTYFILANSSSYFCHFERFFFTTDVYCSDT
jgi:hypothetical protein